MKTLRPEIKFWDCIAHDPIEEWEPEDPSMVEFWCCIAIGLENEEGSDYFHIHVTTEKMLSQLSDKKYLLVLPYYEGWNQVLNAVNAKLKSITGINWEGIGLELSKSFRWEYEKSV